VLVVVVVVVVGCVGGGCGWLGLFFGGCGWLFGVWFSGDGGWFVQVLFILRVSGNIRVGMYTGSLQAVLAMDTVDPLCILDHGVVDPVPLKGVFDSTTDYTRCFTDGFSGGC